MKTFTLLFALLGTARYCSKPKVYSMPGHNNHQEKLKQSLQSDLRSTDSIQKALASKFEISIREEYSKYKPDSIVMAELKYQWNDSITIKVIGGNWCSDTRRELPRLCRVLDEVGALADGFEYYKVDKEKKLLSPNLGQEQDVKKVPTVFIYKNGRLLGKTVETPSKSWERDLLEILR